MLGIGIIENNEGEYAIPFGIKDLKASKETAEQSLVIKSSPTDEAMKKILSLVKSCWPDATSVDIFINSEGLEVHTTDRIITNDTTMKKINGEWCSKI